jgi:hypothetical protein
MAFNEGSEAVNRGVEGVGEHLAAQEWALDFDGLQVIVFCLFPRTLGNKTSSLESLV